VHLDIAAAGARTPAHLLSAVENIEVEADQKARVVIDQKSGTIVLGADVRISRVAVSQGGLTLRVTETPIVIQPNPFSRSDEAIVVPRTQVALDEEPGNGLALVESAVALPDVIAGLNALGVSARDMIDILKAIKAAGALHAEFVVQ